MRLILGAGALVAGMMLPGAAGAQGIVIGTGGENGVYHATGKAICAMLAKSGGPVCEARPSKGSIQNLKDVAAGTVTFAMAQSDWQFHAYRGSSKWDGGKIANLRAVFSVYPEAVQLVARDSIKHWTELKGKKVNIGNPGSGQRETMEEIMAAQGWVMKSFKPASELNSKEHIDAFCDSKIDAFVHVIGIPNAAMAKAVGECHGHILEPNAAIVRKLVTQARPYYSKAVIPAGTYAPSQKKVDTFAVMATLVTTDKADPKLVAALVSAVFGNFDAFKAMHPSFNAVDPKSMISDGLSAPLHPAAKAYYDSKGWK